MCCFIVGQSKLPFNGTAHFCILIDHRWRNIIMLQKSIPNQKFSFNEEKYSFELLKKYFDSSKSRYFLYKKTVQVACTRLPSISSFLFNIKMRFFVIHQRPVGRTFVTFGDSVQVCTVYVRLCNISHTFHDLMHQFSISYLV